MVKIRITKRQEPLVWSSCLVFFGAVALSLGISAALLASQGRPPLKAMLLFFEGAFGSRWALEDCLLKAIPIFLCSLGVGISFRLQIWNIGAEGQYALGAVGATWMALNFPGLPAPVLIPAMMAAAMIAGALWGLIPALLKIRLGVNEIIVTLMLNYIGILFLEYLVYGPWKDPRSFGFPMTPQFPDGAIVGTIGTSSINWGIVLCLVLAVVMFVFYGYSRWGYELRACGDNVRAAGYAAIPYSGLIVLVMMVGGTLAGWAGFLEASANMNRLQPTIVVGYGYTAIVVAWLARLNPFTIGVASFLLAGLRVGVENLQLELKVPAAFGSIMEGLILLTVLAGGLFIHYRVALRRSA